MIPTPLMPLLPLMISQFRNLRKSGFRFEYSRSSARFDPRRIRFGSPLKWTMGYIFAISAATRLPKSSLMAASVEKALASGRRMSLRIFLMRASHVPGANWIAGFAPPFRCRSRAILPLPFLSHSRDSSRTSPTSPFLQCAFFRFRSPLFPRTRE